jgi:hypothetical protein
MGGIEKGPINNHSDINVNVDCIPLIFVICLPIDSFIVSMLLSDNFTTISYGPRYFVNLYYTWQPA